jgi:hypothetical protein
MNVGSHGKQVAVATAAAPIYLEGDAVPLSTDLAGNLRTGVGGTGGAALASWIQYQILPNGGINDGDTPGGPLHGRARFGQLAGDNVTPVLFQPGGTLGNWTLRILDNRRCIQCVPTVALDTTFFLRPNGSTEPNQVDFRDTFPANVTGAIGANVPAQPAYEIQAWVRKVAAGDGSDCRFFLGFAYTRILSPSGNVVRVGLLGDGLGGYGFGSVNAPDGIAVSGDNTPTDHDVNFTQPAELLNAVLLTNWFHVRIKMVPPTPTVGGKWGAYLNGTLVATFTTTANFPRGYNSGGGTVNDNYREIECGLGTYFDSVIVVPSPALYDMRVTVTDDLTL